MSRTRLAIAATCTAMVGLLTCACHEPEQPPVPSHPTNPTNAGVGPVLAEREVAGPGSRDGNGTDASIVHEAGPIPPQDAGIGLFDAAPVGPR